MRGISLNSDKLEDEFEGEQALSEEGNAEMGEMFFSLGKMCCLLSPCKPAVAQQSRQCAVFDCLVISSEAPVIAQGECCFR